MKTIKIKNIKLSSDNAAWYWNGRNFDTKDYWSSGCGSADPVNYDFSDNIEEELQSAKKYADEKHESGEWILSGKNVYVDEVEFDIEDE